MSERNRRQQQGLTLVSMVVVCVLLIMVVLLGIKVAPDVIEYNAVIKTVKATATDPATRTATVADIRRAFDKRKLIDNISAIDSSDLDISKEGNEVVIAFAYTKKIPLYGPVSLSIDFEGNSSR